MGNLRALGSLGGLREEDKGKGQNDQKGSNNPLQHFED